MWSLEQWQLHHLGTCGTCKISGAAPATWDQGEPVTCSASPSGNSYVHSHRRETLSAFPYSQQRLLGLTSPSPKTICAESSGVSLGYDFGGTVFD